MRCHFDRAPVDTPALLPALYPAGEFRSRFRSTVPLLSLVQHHKALLREILGACGLGGDIDLHFEFKVRSPRGQGKASQTDLMVMTAAGCMAVEAKWTEPPYDTVAAWLGDSPTDNRLEVVRGWLDLIGSRIGTTPPLDAVRAITYQTIHRAASACHAGPAARLAYLQFLSPDHKHILQHRRADLTALHDALGRPLDFPMLAVGLAIAPTQAFIELSAHRHDSEEMEHAVKQALPVMPLFTFGEWQVHRLP